MIGTLLAAVIQLSGVTGESLRARSYFDVNNVTVGDPLVLTVDFIGEADFKSLHPPALSRYVNGEDWKVDDLSAKTETYRDARRLVYRVRPMREGVLYFPALEFGYASADGASRAVKSNVIPVHSKKGAQVEVAELGSEVAMPQPDALLLDSGVELGDDESFAWRKACAAPKADAFVQFDFPAARFNEARCAILEGNWARALKIYHSLEWRVGQTPALERGIVAALALKYGNPSAELPVWRKVGRPLLRYGWKGRLACVLGILAALFLIFRLSGKLLRLAACLLVFVPLQSSAQSLFDPIEEFEREIDSFFGGRFRNPRSAARDRAFHNEIASQVKAGLSVDRKDVQVGDSFEYVIELEVPKRIAVGNIEIMPLVREGMRQTGRIGNFADRESDNPSNTVKRFSIPVRYDVPFEGGMAFSLTVPYAVERRIVQAGYIRRSVERRSMSVNTPVIPVKVRPLPEKGKPADFSGIIAERVELEERTDLRKVETNDIVQVTYALRVDGRLPRDFTIPETAFELERHTDPRTGATGVAWRRYFVADGDAATPEVSVNYYDVADKTYKTVKAGKTQLEYVPAK